MKALRKTLKVFIFFLTSLILFFSLVKWLFLEAYLIPSESMKPTLLVNDFILVNKIKYGIRVPFTQFWLMRWQKPQRGDVVIFKKPHSHLHYVKRVIAIEGDEISVSQEGFLTINQHQQKYEEFDNSHRNDINQNTNQNVNKNKFKNEKKYFESLISPPLNHPIYLKNNYKREVFKTHKVSKNHVFVMGDNRDQSNDSRFWGDLHMDFTLGTAEYVWLSCEESNELDEGNESLCEWDRIRWSRVFQKIL